ncbi:hypothetical protein Tcan_06206 [Toxocara canis]|uniref:Uncharacterized protein n=1 Tax=Toxocara canis TaxID=6265 RepID=A0A0B2VLA5_TOXCA|nr:hypothetical protein Tcan_06206 [Toxocara canis]
MRLCFGSTPSIVLRCPVWRRNRKIVGGGGILTQQWLDGRLPLLIIEKSSTAEVVYYKPWLDTRSCPLCAIRLARIFKFCGVLLLATALLSLYYLSFPKEYDIVRRAEVFQNLRAFKSMRYLLIFLDRQPLLISSGHAFAHLNSCVI